MAMLNINYIFDFTGSLTLKLGHPLGRGCLWKPREGLHGTDSNEAGNLIPKCSEPPLPGETTFSPLFENVRLFLPKETIMPSPEVAEFQRLLNLFKPYSTISHCFHSYTQTLAYEGQAQNVASCLFLIGCYWCIKMQPISAY